jgi:zinc/manganese transport system permease protein
VFSSFMANTWIVATIVAVVAGLVGFFVVLRGASFVAHAVPQGAFTGAAGAALAGVSTIGGLIVFSLLGALGIGWLGRRGRHDVATALGLVALLGLGALFLGLSTEYSEQTYALLFGEILGVSRSDVATVAVLAAVCVVAVVVLYRPLLLSSVMAELGEVRGVRAHRMEAAFLVVVALATTMALPVVGALLIFSLMVGPPAAARSLTARPQAALVLSAAISVVTVWTAVAVSYRTNWPVSFVVGVAGGAWYAVGRGVAGLRRGRGLAGLRRGRAPRRRAPAATAS